MPRNVAARSVVQAVEDKRAETPEEKFQRLANRRVNHVLNHLRVLGNLSNRANYRYTDEQITRIFGTVEAAVGDTKALFRPRKKIEFRF
jgi:hypothetical protein